MQKIALPFVLLFLLVGFQSFAHQSKKLIHRNNLKGWYAYSADNGKPEKATDLFELTNGVIRMYGPHAGYLMSEQTFSDFELTAEFRWNTDSTFTRKSNKKNSGFMYLVPESTPDTLWPKGIQFQIKEGASGDFILLQQVSLEQDGKTIAPGRSVVVKCTSLEEKTSGEWNQIRIRVEKGHIQQYLNGKLVNEGENPSVTSGRILLQYEGFPIDFKEIYIQEL